MKTARFQIAAKIETVQGTPEVLAAGDVIRAANPVFSPGVEMHDLQDGNGSLSPTPQMAGGTTGTITFDVWLRGSGAAGTPPEWGKLLKACGMVEDVDAGAGVNYLPSDDDTEHESLTIGYYVDGKLYQIAGCMGNAVISLVAGKPCKIAFTFTGVAWTVTDVAILTGVNTQDTLPPIFKDGLVDIDGEDGCIETITVNLNNSVQLRPCANAASGYSASYLGSRRFTMSLDPEAVLAAAKDWYADWTAGTTFAFTATLGATAGNKIIFTAPACQLTNVNPADKAGMLIEPMECLLCGSSGGDEFKITFDTDAGE